MTKLIVAAALALLLACVGAKYNKFINTDGELIIDGEISWQEWQENAGWDSYVDENYYPHPEVIDILRKLANEDGYRYMVFAGTWCSDSEEQMPRIFQLFVETGISDEKISLYGVNREKKDISGMAEKHGIQFVPTLIIFYGERELGRIIETPETNWEEDLLRFFN